MKQKVEISRGTFLPSIMIIILTFLSFCMVSVHYLSVVLGKQYWNALLERFAAKNLTKTGSSALMMGYWESYGCLLFFLEILLVIVLSMKDTRQEFFSNIKRNINTWIIL